MVIPARFYRSWVSSKWTLHYLSRDRKRSKRTRPRPAWSCASWVGTARVGTRWRSNSRRAFSVPTPDARRGTKGNRKPFTLVSFSPGVRLDAFRYAEGTSCMKRRRDRKQPGGLTAISLLVIQKDTRFSNSSRYISFCTLAGFLLFCPFSISRFFYSGVGKTRRRSWRPLPETRTLTPDTKKPFTPAPRLVSSSPSTALNPNPEPRTWNPEPTNLPC